MSFSKNISISDLAQLLIIRYYIVSCRSNKSFNYSHQWNSIRTLSYFADVIAIPTSKKFRSLEDIINSIKLKLHNDYFSIEIESYMKSINDFEQFVTAIESSITVLESNSTIDPNELSGPNLIMTDSFLGMFVRSILAQWDCLLFEDISLIYKLFMNFISNNDNLNNNAASSNINYIHQGNEFNNQNINNHSLIKEQRYDTKSYQTYLLAEDSLSKGDVSFTEDTIHHFYDYNGTNPLLSLATTSTSTNNDNSKDPEIGSFSNIQRVLIELHRCNDVAYATHSKHQHAMLSLARMWLENNNSTMAFSAIEEALKTAQQREDHLSVSHALLLLYDLFQSSNQPELIASSEDILIRCTKRCGSLNLQYLTAQCTLLLSLIRSKKLFYTTNNIIMNIKESSEQSEDSLLHWDIEKIWSQITFSLLGEISLSCQVISLDGIKLDTEFIAAATTGNMNPIIQNMGLNNMKKDNIQEIPFNISNDFISLSIQACLISCDVWIRTGSYYNADFIIRRCLRQYRIISKINEIFEIYTKSLMIKTDLIHSTLIYNNNININNNPNISPYQDIINLAKKLKRFCPNNISNKLKQSLTYSITYVLIYNAIYLKQYDKALRLSKQLIELTSNNDLKIKTDNSEFIDNNYILINEDNIKARILFGDVLLLCNYWKEAIEIFCNLSIRCKLYGFLLWQYLSDVKQLEALLLIEKTNNKELYSDKIANILIKLQQILNISRQYNFGLIESYISKIIMELFNDSK